MNKKVNDILVYFTMCLILLIKSIGFIYFFVPEEDIGGSKTIFNILNYTFVWTTYMYLYVAFILLVTSFFFLLKGKGRVWYLFWVDLVLTVLLFADLVYFNGFSSFLSFFHIQSLSTIEEGASGIGSLINPQFFILFIDLLVLIPIMIVTAKTNEISKRSPIIFILILLVAVNGICNTERWSTFTGLRYQPSDTMITQSPIGYHLHDIYTYVESQYRTVSKEEKDSVHKWMNENKEELPNNEYYGLFKEQNLITIHFESLEQFVINEKVNGQEITPNLNKLLKNSLYFDNYHEIVNEGISSDAEFTTNTSLYPIRKGAVSYVYPELKYNTLPAILNQNGYETTIYHPDKEIFWNWEKMHTSLGFKNIYSESDYHCEERTSIGITDGCLLNKVSDFIQKQKKPFYSSVVTMTSHMPFIMPEEHQELKLDKNLENTELGHYFQAIHYTDKQLGLFLDKLEEQGLMDNTVVAVYGDHMGVHKYYFNQVSAMEGIKPEWKDISFKVPLIIYQKNYLDAKTISVLGNQADFLPTISYLLGINDSYYKDYAMGKVLVNTTKEYTLLNDGSILFDKPISEEERKHILDSFIISETITKMNNHKE
ncbi:LTA synthase family protein [Bacillus sp. M6-12]|uniref:LTA synthase family protein n=1 Tax=Bacillus sp. M6-12 TaxID=2054166 RepID=UPI0015E07163|nr:LTA synthase family protein [Bacillus sp. M6-12]